MLVCMLTASRDALSPGSPVDSTVWVSLGGVALMEDYGRL